MRKVLGAGAAVRRTSEEDRRIRLPSLRVRDVDAEANSNTRTAARGLAIRGVGGVQVPQALRITN